MFSQSMTNRQKWINALRSGEYQQGRQRLKDNDRFCCLGVACDIYHKETGKCYWTIGDNFSNGSLIREGYILNEVLEWINLPTRNETVLVNMNDKLNKTFLEIADYLESLDE